MICAHRGDTTRGAKENSLDAIRDAIADGAEMIEIDVQMTSDGSIICHHDETLDSADDRKVWEHSMDELRRDYDANILPSFEDVLDITSGEIYLNIEMKEYSPRLPKVFVEPLVELVRKYGMHEYSLYSSFRFEYLQVLPWDALSIAIQPTTEYIDFFNSRSLQPIFLPKRVEDMLPSEIMTFSKATAYACMLSELTPERLENIRSRNIHLSVYTISSIAEFEKARSLGAKAVVTDIPEELLKFRKYFQ